MLGPDDLDDWKNDPESFFHKEDLDAHTTKRRVRPFFQQLPLISLTQSQPMAEHLFYTFLAHYEGVIGPLIATMLRGPFPTILPSPPDHLQTS